MFKYIVYAINILKSFGYDFILLFSINSLKQRAFAKSFIDYRANKLYPPYLKQGGAVEGARYLASKFCVGNGVDIGCGIWPIEGARPIENNNDENAYILKDADATLDYVFSSHLLEHLDEPERALREWARALKKGGVLLLYLPHPACKMWSPEHLKEHVWMPSPISVESLISSIDKFIIKDILYTPDGMMSYYVLAEKI